MEMIRRTIILLPPLHHISLLLLLLPISSHQFTLGIVASCAVLVAVSDSFVAVVKFSDLPHPDIKSEEMREASREKPLP